MIPKLSRIFSVSSNMDIFYYCNRINKPFFNIFKKLSTSNSVQKQEARNLKGRSKSSQEWLVRQLADPYVEKAKMQRYRCRSSFKLLEMDDRFRFLRPGQVALDCGAAPGSWTQVLVQRTNSLGTDLDKPRGKVVAVDRLPIYPVDGATILGNADFTLPTTLERLLSVLEGSEVDVFVSDMAPNASGVRTLDHENIVALARAALAFATRVSRVDATLLVKIWDGGDSKVLERELERYYKRVKNVKPAASRTDSAEKFLLARGFRGLKT